MATIAPKPQKVVQIPKGTFLARCYSLIHLGVQDVEWKGEKKTAYKIRLGFELPTKKSNFNGVEKPLVISKEYTLSMGEMANLRKVVEALIGTTLTESEAVGFDVESILGKACLISVIHTERNGNTYANIGDVLPLMEGQECPEQFNETVLLSFENWNDELFASMPDFIKDKISKSPQFQKMMKAPAKAEEVINPDDIPFN